MITIEGTIQKILFRNEENFYTVARLEGLKNNENKAVTIIGKFSSISIGDTYSFQGDWVNHKTYGKQFAVEIYEEKLPTSEYGIEKYLASGMIKGLGPKTAKKIVEHFGASVFDVLESEPERLLEIKGISKSKMEKIIESFNSQRQMKNIMSYLASYDISPTNAVKIYQTYGMDCIEVLKNNPYKLAEDIWGIGFKIADSIARRLGLPLDSQFRISAFIIYLLQEGTVNGHLFLEKNYLIESAIRELGISKDLIEKNLEDMVEFKKIIFDKDAVYLRGLYQLEFNVAEKVKVFKEIQPLPAPTGEEFRAIQEQVGVILSASQREALYQVFSSGIVIITGGPGTGKTTTIRSIILWADKLGLSVSLAAPTGRAAKRLSETTGRQATTIHRLLGYIPGDNEFIHNEDEPLDSNLVIIDEASMIDIYLFNSLLRGLTGETRIILVGDIDQLPSVGPGNILSDLISSKLFNTIYLKTIFRQAKESYIILNSHRINQGKFPVLKEGTDFVFLEIEEPEEIARMIITLCAYELKNICSNPVDDMQVLSPMHRGPIGVASLNLDLQKIFNPPSPSKKEVKHGTYVLREGDKVMQIVNNYKKQVFNGDLGRIVEIDTEEQEVWVRLIGDELVVSYDFQELNELILAYASTIHKSQGCEYPVVIMPVSTQHYIMLQRNLIYTGVTRAKLLVILVGTSKALHIAIKNDKVSKRNTKLVERLCNEVEKVHG